MNKLNKIFNKEKPIIGMLHLDYLLGQKEYGGVDFLIERAKKDIDALQTGGVDGILIENWKEDSVGEFVEAETAVSMAVVVSEIVKSIKVPFGINVLNNDYKVAYSLAATCGASFVELDVLVDEVESDFTYGDEGKKNPFRIVVNKEQVKEYANKVGMSELPLFCFVQPKHYKMIDTSKSIEQSVKEASEYGVTGVLVTKATGVAPTLDLVTKAKQASSNLLVGIGSGVNEDNMLSFLKIVDFAVVGSAFKYDGDVDNMVELDRVKKIMDIAKTLR